SRTQSRSPPTSTASSRACSVRTAWSESSGGFAGAQELALVVEHRLVGLAEPAVFDLHHDDRVLVNGIAADDTAQHPGGHVLDERQAQGPRCPVVAVEALVVVGGELRGDRPVARAEDMDQ